MWYLKTLIILRYYILLLDINTLHNNIITSNWFNTISQNSIGDTIADANSDKLVSKHRDLFFKRGKILDKILKIRKELQDRIKTNKILINGENNETK